MADDGAAAAAGVVMVAAFDTMRALRDGVVTGVDALDGRAADIEVAADSADDEADALIALPVLELAAEVTIAAADADLSGVRALCTGAAVAVTLANELKIGLAAATATLAAAAGLTAEVGRTAAAAAAAGALIADAILGAGAGDGDAFLAATGVLMAEEAAREAAPADAVGVASETSIMASFADDEAELSASSSSSPSHCSIETEAAAAAFDGECCCAGTHGTVDKSSAAVAAVGK